MKKFTSLLFLTASLFIFSVTFVSCFLLEGDDEYTDNRPDIEQTSEGVIVSAHKLSDDIEYINIYRTEVTTTTKNGKTVENNGDVINIGVLYPSEFDKDDATYIYEDKLVVKDHTYKYRARYYDNAEDEYYTTNWTDNVNVANSNLTSDSQMKFNTTGVYLSYSDSEYPTLRLINSSKILGFDSFSTAGYSLALVLSTDEYSQVFTLDDDFLSGDSTISCLSFLPAEFLNTEVKVTGFIGQKIEYKTYEDGTKKEKRIFWTQPVSLTVKKGSTVLGSFTVKSETGASGIDYSFPSDSRAIVY